MHTYSFTHLSDKLSSYLLGILQLDEDYIHESVAQKVRVTIYASLSFEEL